MFHPTFNFQYNPEGDYYDLVLDKNIQQFVDELKALPHDVLIRYLTYWSDAIDSRKYEVESDLPHDEWYSDCCDYAASETDEERYVQAKCMAQTLGHMLQDIKVNNPDKYKGAMRTVRSWKRYTFIGFTPTMREEIDKAWTEPQAWEDGKAAAQAYVPLLTAFMQQREEGRMAEAAGNAFYLLERLGRLYCRNIDYFEQGMTDYIDDFAEAQQTTREGAIAGLRQQYDGYHFTWPSPDIFNPFSLLNAFQDHDYTNYWFSSGTPTYLIEMLRKFDVVPSAISQMQVLASDFDAPTENMASITPLLYQSGYVTIKDYDRASRLYTLDIPNNEIRVGLMESLLPNYVERRTEAGNTTIAKMYLALCREDIDEMCSLLQAYLLTVPYCNNANSEGHYQQLFYVIFSLFGRYVEVEARTVTGRVDVVMKTAKALYLFELKLNMSAEAAMKQMDVKNYAAKFALSGLPIVKVGINFDPKRRTLSDWKVIESS